MSTFSRRVGLGVTGLALLAACQTASPTGSHHTTPASPAASGGIALDSNTGRPVATPTGSGGALVVPSSAPGQTVVTAPSAPAVVPSLPPVRKLVQPSGTTALSGVVQIDASYIVAQGGGNIVAQGGGNIVAQGGGNIVAQGGGNLIVASGGGFVSNNGSAIVAQGGGNFVSNNGSAIVAQGGGNIVAQGGGNIVAQGGGNFIGHNGSAIVAQGGGNVIADDGLNIVAQGGGNLVSEGGGAIVAQGGGNFVSNNGSAIVAQGGGNFVSHNGSAIVAQGGGNFRVLAPHFDLLDTGASTSASPTASPTSLILATGTVLPVAGMRISVIQLETNEPVPIGKDPKGNPVYTVYTNADGKYDLYLDPKLVGNVQVVANVRLGGVGGNPLVDPNPRFRYDAVAKTGKPADVDEDVSVVAEYLLNGFAPRLAQILRLRPDQAADWVDNTFGLYPAPSPSPGAPPDPNVVNGIYTNKGFGKQLAGAAPVLYSVVSQIAQAAVDSHLDQAPDDVVNRVAYRLGQQALEQIKLSDVQITSDSSPYYHPAQSENAVTAMQQILRHLREQVVNVLPPKRTGYIEQQSFFKEAYCNGWIKPNFRIQEASDVPRFVVEAYLVRGGTDSPWDEIRQVLQSFGADDLPPTVNAPGSDQRDRLQAAVDAVVEQSFISELDQVGAAVDYIKKHAYNGPAVPRASAFNFSPSPSSGDLAGTNAMSPQPSCGL